MNNTQYNSIVQLEQLSRKSKIQTNLLRINVVDIDEYYNSNPSECEK